MIGDPSATIKKQRKQTSKINERILAKTRRRLPFRKHKACYNLEHTQIWNHGTPKVKGEAKLLQT